MKKTKIIATIGPASSSKDILKTLITSGMDAIRLNSAHGSLTEFSRIIDEARKIKDIPFVLDLKGPEIRICTDRKYPLKINEKIKISFNKRSKLHFNHFFLAKTGEFALVNDGLLKLRIVESTRSHVILSAKDNLVIKNNLRVNLPTLAHTLPILSEKDLEYIRFAKKKKIDYIALSYTRNKKDVLDARKAIDGSNIGIIAKIETGDGIENIDEIISAADGVMVARGDLGVEIPSEKLPMIQKEIISKCNQKGILVITATQMLQSMIENSTPTRAETSDVANAILDGTDCVMLSGETAIGKHPVLSIKEICKIASETESHVKENIIMTSENTVSEAISRSIQEMAKHLPISKIITLTRTGYTARLISRFKLKQKVIAITPSDTVKKKLELYYGIIPVVIPEMPTRERIEKTAKYLLKRKLIAKNDLLLFTAGVFPVKTGSTNLIEVHRAKDLI